MNEKKFVGICMICGDAIYEGHFLDNFIHDCEGGRILLYRGMDAYHEWLRGQKCVSLEEVLKDLLREAEQSAS